MYILVLLITIPLNLIVCKEPSVSEYSNLSFTHINCHKKI